MTDRPATPAPDGPVPNHGQSWERPTPASSPDPQPDLPGRAGPTPSDAPTPLPVAATSLSPADQLLAADPDRLPGYDPAPLADADRPPAEYRALSAALGCPDLFLADADAGPDQLRFAAELAAEAARAGQRVLVVTPTPADADAVFARLVSGIGLPVGRALASYEHPDRLPAAAAGCTARAHRDALLADARARAAAGVADAEARLASLRAAGEAAGPARAAVGRLTGLTAERARLDRDRDEVDADAQQAAADLEAKRKELVALRDHASHAGKRGSGVLGLFRGMFSQRPTLVDDAEHQARAVEEEVGRLEGVAARVVDERGRVVDRLAELDRERAQAEADFRRVARAFAAAGLGELAPSPEAVDRAAAAIPALVAQIEAELTAAGHPVADLDSPAAALRVLARVRAVVATFDAVGADPLTLPPEGDGPAFDRLVLTDADRLNEAGFDHAARSAARWVLVGDAFGPRTRPGPHRNGRPPRPALFRRLWAHLHREAWVSEAGRLVAVLTDADPDRLTREPLADRPDVELRFARGADGEPVLAEVAFPPTAAAAEAKAFLAGELGEVRLSPCGPVHWHETDDRLTACWPAADAPHADWAELAPGVREKVVGAGPDCRTAAVAFERSAGWDRDSAGRWLAEHADSPRTAVLPRPTVIAPAPSRLVAGVPG